MLRSLSLSIVRLLRLTLISLLSPILSTHIFLLLNLSPMFESAKAAHIPYIHGGTIEKKPPASISMAACGSARHCTKRKEKELKIEWENGGSARKGRAENCMRYYSYAHTYAARLRRHKRMICLHEFRDSALSAEWILLFFYNANITFKD